MQRRHFLSLLAAASGAGLLPPAVRANVLVSGSAREMPPTSGRDAFVQWMRANRGEDPAYLAQRWERYQALLGHHDVWGERNIRGFLMTPREEFVTRANLDRAYEWHYLDIGFGVTITGPHTVARMTSTIDVGPDERVLEIGTGSGYQSAYLANLTGNVWTIEIIPALYARTRALYQSLIARGYSEYGAINTRNADGYFGWAEAAPFDKIIVTCGIDHVPPALLQQLKPNGIMVIPVGPPGAQHVLKIVKQTAADGSITVKRSDIYGGAIIPFVPFTKWEGGVFKGTHNF